MMTPEVPATPLDSAGAGDSLPGAPAAVPPLHRESLTARPVSAQSSEQGTTPEPADRPGISPLRAAQVGSSIFRNVAGTLENAFGKWNNRATADELPASPTETDPELPATGTAPPIDPPEEPPTLPTPGAEPPEEGDPSPEPAEQVAAQETPRTVLTTEEYVRAFEEGKPVTIPPDARLLGRIIRGRTPDDFEQLAADDRRLVFTMGSDGLEILPGRPLRESLATIGLSPEYVQGRIDQGYTFKLAVFQAEEPGTQATWDNALSHVAEAYPELADDIAQHASALPDQQLANDIEQIDLAGPADPRFMSLQRYLDVPADVRAQDPSLLRRVLLHEAHLGTLFDGTGHTLTPDGKQGMTEHLMPNGPLAGLQNAALIDLV